jgi:hypothetical protein
VRVIARFHAAMRKKLANRIGVRSISSVVWQNPQRPRWAPNRRLAEGRSFPLAASCILSIAASNMFVAVNWVWRSAGTAATREATAWTPKLELLSCELLLFADALCSNFMDGSRYRR